MKFLSKLKFREMLHKTKEVLISSSESNVRLSMSVGIAVFSGIIPAWGFQTIIAIILSYALRLNKFLMITVSNFSQPPVTPFVIAGSFLLGGLFLNTEKVLVDTSNAGYELIKSNFLQYAVGSTVLAVILGFVSGVTTYCLLVRFRGDRNETD